MTQPEVLKQIRPRLEEGLPSPRPSPRGRGRTAFGDGFRAAVLYGSAARGDDQATGASHMRRTILACIVALTCLSGCDRGRTDRAAAPASLGEQIERVFQARLPQSVGEVQVESVVLMTRVVYGTFTCSRSDLADFLASSRLLPDGLTAGVNPAAPVNSPLPWWQPQTLSDPAGNECYWEDGEDVASGLLSAGWSGSDDATVYFMAVYENKRQSGLRPDVKADPNWGK